ncbi:hypothetical protein OBV_07830 [Oscillibacter valericigenes Sjm18-20]|nr:hypothetical protein OBV_07830 [Oscillibacter valericigenes Sjm18-20]
MKFLIFFTNLTIQGKIKARLFIPPSLYNVNMKLIYLCHSFYFLRFTHYFY